jgi:2,4-dienoyl-CoA reductase-like NADH-dependent reductase (Old Yellow Enzyme family)
MHYGAHAMPSLFEPYKLGSIRLANRIVMAPMTRSRARNAALAPDADTALYYAQRAGAGLIVSEGAVISVEGRGWAHTPGIHTPEQIAGWRGVTDAVHAKGGVIFAQLWHAGRSSHVSLQKDRRVPVSCVGTRAAGVVTYSFDDTGKLAQLAQSKARALNIDEIHRITAEFVQAARNAIAAGFDGVELHAADGYIFEQFINGVLNTRDDVYGGAPIKNRLRFTLETVDAIAAAIGGERTGIRLSPFGRYNDMHHFKEEAETWLTLAAELSRRKLAYAHVVDQTTMGQFPIPADFMPKFRRAFGGTLIAAGGYLEQNGQEALDAKAADLIAIGKPFIPNPDLVERLRNDWPLAAIYRGTLYDGGSHGYTDYPTYEEILNTKRSA